MECVLDTYDLYTYIDAHAVPKCENVVIVEIDSLKKNQRWEIVPRS